MAVTPGDLVNERQIGDRLLLEWLDQLMPGAMVFWRRIQFIEWITALHIHTNILKKISGVVATTAAAVAATATATTIAAVAVLCKLASKK
ncbi:unnamed protein product [Litomosoides sigmodontis]|uniref:Uncharacterized protein n=1 Tax=Litomosoides sigmodontis TaxID=42156 RepID=A0A3P6SAI1_LITSI|nr:unnamed protein product [Litomosoides sigmodontis]